MLGAIPKRRKDSAICFSVSRTLIEWGGRTDVIIRTQGKHYFGMYISAFETIRY